MAQEDCNSNDCKTIGYNGYGIVEQIRCSFQPFTNEITFIKGRVERDKKKKKLGGEGKGDAEGDSSKEVS